MLQDKLGAPNYCVPHGQMVLLACKAPEFDLYNNCATHCAHRVNKVICPKAYDPGIRCTYFGDTQALLLFMYYIMGLRFTVSQTILYGILRAKTTI